MEPILTPTTDRFTVFPIKYTDLWTLYKKAVGSFWTAEEIDLSGDLKDWVRLSETEKHFIKMVLAFFASSDGIVMENINLNFGAEVQISEARLFYAYQGFNEAIHGETYSLMINKFAKDPDEEAMLLSSLRHSPVIREKADGALNWMGGGAPFAQRLVAFMCIEGIFFSGAFCSIFWLKKRGIMPGLCFSNELISRDEGSHLEFAVALYSHLQEKAGDDVIRAIVQSAVEIEECFITEALPCKLIGMDAEQMKQYIRYVGDRLMKQLGQEPIFGTTNPFAWMETISLEGKTNFFEKRVGDYSKHMVTEGDEVKFDEEF